jgi:GWxTD domain-containing protein
MKCSTFFLKLIPVLALIWGFQFPVSAKISATIDYITLPGEKNGGNLLLIFGVDGRSLQYQRLPNKKYQATATFAIVINDSVKNYFAEKIDFQTPEVADSNAFGQMFSNTKTIGLPAGKYTVEIAAFDKAEANSKPENATFSVKVLDASQGPVMSDLAFINSQAIDPAKSIVDQNPAVFRNSDFFAANDTVLSIYAEAKGFLKNFPNRNSLIGRVRILEAETRSSLDSYGKIKKLKSQAFFASVFDLNIKKLPTGNYIIIWDIADSTGKVLCRTQKTFQKSNPFYTKTDFVENQPVNGNLEEEISKLNTNQCREMVASLLPIATASEQSTISYLTKKGNDNELRRYLSAFWSKKDKENPVGSFLNFKELMVYGSKKYATQTMPAYQTDRGRVLLQYGKPNLVENEYSDRFRKAMQNLNTVPYEIWYYYTLDKPVKQSDVIFVFVQENRGNDNYRLLHSTGIGEVRNREWRKAVETNATYNWDRLDPNDRYDPTDSKKFR